MVYSILIECLEIPFQHIGFEYDVDMIGMLISISVNLKAKWNLIDTYQEMMMSNLI